MSAHSQTEPIDPDDLEAQMLNIGRVPLSQTSQVGQPPRARPTPKRRGPGRPKKPKAVPPPQASQPEVTFDDDDDIPRTQPPETGEPEPEPATEEPKIDDSFEARRVLCEKIESMRTRFGGRGTGLVPDPQRHSVIVLQAELDVLNQQVDCRRGEKTIRLVTVTFIAPVLTMIADMIGQAVEKSGKPRPFDLDGLSKVVSEDWDHLFADAAAQIAINNPSFFSTSPVVQFGEGMLGACFQTNLMNAAKKAQQAQ